MILFRIFVYLFTATDAFVYQRLQDAEILLNQAGDSSKAYARRFGQKVGWKPRLGMCLSAKA